MLIVEDQPLWRDRIRSILTNHPRWSIIGEASTGPEAVRKAAELRPDVIVLDIGIPELNGLAAAQRILAADAELKILFFSDHRSPSIVEAALRFGARGYLLKSDALHLLEALAVVSEGGTFVSEELADDGHHGGVKN